MVSKTLLGCAYYLVLLCGSGLLHIPHRLSWRPPLIIMWEAESWLPQRGQHLIPQSVNVRPARERGLADVSRPRALGWEGWPGSSRWTQSDHRPLKSENLSWLWSECRMWLWKKGKGGHWWLWGRGWGPGARTCVQTLEKARQQTVFSRVSGKECSPTDTSMSAQSGSCWIRTCRIVR